jgi:hypothetical protein
MIKTKIYYLLCFAFFLSCTQRKDDPSLIIDNTQCKSVAVSDIFSKWRLVELDYLINKVDDFAILDGNFFIVDRQLESIKIFDAEGKILKVIAGDLFENGRPIQPVCLFKSHDGEVGFYDAANQQIILLNKEFSISRNWESKFYAYKIYTTPSGYIIYKNQSQQKDENEEYRYDVLVTDKDFNVVNQFFDFNVELNVPRTWRFFYDPINITPNGFEYFEPFSDDFQNFSENYHQAPIPIRFLKNGFQKKNLKGVDLDDPNQMVEEVIKKYALVNAKRLQTDTSWGIRFVDDFKSKFYFEGTKQAGSGICISELYLKNEDGKLILPFPSYVEDSSWIAVLDGYNYEVLLLSSYSHLHPVIDHVIQEGKTYLLILEN